MLKTNAILSLVLGCVACLGVASVASADSKASTSLLSRQTTFSKILGDKCNGKAAISGEDKNRNGVLDIFLDDGRNEAKNCFVYCDGKEGVECTDAEFNKVVERTQK